MRIKLENFIGHTNTEVEIKRGDINVGSGDTYADESARETMKKKDNTGFILLSGDNGVGKTSILKGVFYALYGYHFSPKKFDTKFCRVTLSDFHNMTIIRRSDPKSLVIHIDDEEYHDDAAQDYINQTLNADSDSFIASSFITSSTAGSVISLTPSQQLKFMENIAYEDQTHTLYKKKCSDYIKARETELSVLTDRIEYINGMVETKESNIPGDFDPDVKYDTNDLKKRVRQMTKKRKKLIGKLDEVKMGIEENQDYLRRIEKIEYTIEKLTSDIEEFDVEIAEYSKPGEYDTEIEELEEKLEDLNSIRVDFDKQKEIDRLEERINDMKSGGLTKKELKKLKKACLTDKEFTRLSTLYEQYSSGGDVRSRLGEINIEAVLLTSSEIGERYDVKMDKVRRPATMIKRLNNKVIPVIQETINTLKASIGEKYPCPGCGMHLVYDNGLIEAVKTKKPKTAKKRLADAQKDMSELNSILVTIGEYVELSEQIDVEVVADFEKNEEKYNVAVNAREKLEMMEKGNYDKIEKKIKKIKKSMKHQDFPDDIEEDRAGLSERIHDLRVHSGEVKTLMRKKGKKERELQEARELMVSRIDIDLGSMKTKAAGLEDSIMDINTRIEKLQKKLLAASEHSSMYEKIEEIEGLVKDLMDAKKRQKAVKTECKNAIYILDIIKEAEVRALQGIVSTINSIAKRYMTMFFDTTPIVELRCEFGGTRPKIETYVHNKGHKYNRFAELSDGEQEKCQLAYLLAVNDYVGTGLMMLDECFGHLDQEKKADILQRLNDMTDDKMIIVVAHSASKGIFDQVIEL